MSRKALGLAVLLVASTVVAAPAPASAAATLHVDDAFDCDESDGDPYYCEIQTAVDAATAGDTIQIAAGTYTGTGAIPVVFIAKDLTIIGAGQATTFIDGQDARQGLAVGSADVSVSQLTIRNGFTAGSGANASVDGAGADLDLTDVTLADGLGEAAAGGLLVGASATADLIRVTVSGNSETDPIGIGKGAGLVVKSGSVVTITDSTFSNNTSVAHGGAINVNEAASLTITDSVFTSNHSTTGYGGALLIHATGAAVTITGTTFQGNTAAQPGGAIAKELGTLSIEGSLFEGNTAGTHGGGLFHESGAIGLSVVNTTFFDNEATSGWGGGAYGGGYYINTTFSGNHAGVNGGGLARAATTYPNVANSILAGNTASGLGADCYQLKSEGHNLMAVGTDCVFSGDTVGNVTGQNPLLMPLAANGGPTMTMALAVGSPARHAGNPDPADPTDWDAADDAGDGDWSCAPTDQRGDARNDVRCDIGAFEVGRVVRYAGANRYDTAATISEGDFTDPAPVTTVFIATGSNFPDGLAGAAAAAKTGGPLLLVDSGVPAETAAELIRLAPDEIVILGGTGAVSDPVETTLQGYAPVTRVSGATRYLTAIAISQWAFPVDGTADVVFVATGVNFPDALAAGAAAGALNGPVLLVPGSEADLPAEVGAEILRLDPATIVVVGGAGAVSDGIYQDLEELQPSDTVTRISGADRYATAAAISAYAFAADLARFYVATGVNFPDALAGSGAAGWWNGPVLLVPGSSIPAEVVAEVNRLTLPNSTVGIILGGTGVVGTTVEDALVTLLGP